MMKTSLVSASLSCLFAWAQLGVAQDIYQFAYESSSPTSASSDVPTLSRPCELGASPEYLTLEIVVERILCSDPELRKTWATAKAQKAQVGVEQSAYLPRLVNDTDFTFARYDTNSGRQSHYSGHARQRQLASRLRLSWLLFDFGQREAALRNARHQLVATNASYERRLQESIMLAGQLYYDAVAAQQSQITALQVAALAEENLVIASAKYEAGVAALSDRLRAQSAYSEASLDQVRAAGALHSLKGRLAVCMGQPPQTPFKIVAGAPRHSNDRSNIQNIDKLMEQAQKDHPALVAARAKVEASKAVVNESLSDGRATISFIGNLSGARNYRSASSDVDSHLSSNSIALQLNIPLFDGFERKYRVRRAQAELEVSKAALTNVEEEIALEVWASYQSLRIEAHSLRWTSKWVDQSHQALKIVQGRYRSGVGSMDETLNALATYATAKQQHINASRNWQQARLRLAAGLGELGFWVL
jgi:outer membrane protein